MLAALLSPAPPRGAPVRRRSTRSLELLLVLALAGSALTACAATRPPQPPVPEVASAALLEARGRLREEGPEARAAARAAAERAAVAAPDWVAPRRLLDELDRADLVGVDALEAHERALRRDPWSAAQLYLAGRLRGRAGAAYFERALQADARLAWSHHGLAWSVARRGRWGTALKHERRALARARDPWERTFFVSTMARYHGGRGQTERAVALLEERMTEAEVSAIDRVELGVQAARLELAATDEELGRRGRARALELLRTARLTGSEIEALTLLLRVASPDVEVGDPELQLALAHQEHPTALRVLASLKLDERPSRLALALIERSWEIEGREPGGGPLLRAARFGAGDFAGAVEGWLAALPVEVVGADGLPRDEHLAAVVRAAREYGDLPEGEAADGPRAERLTELGATLVASGWFREARAVADALAAYDLDRALALEQRALAGRDLVAGLRRLSLGGAPQPLPAAAADGSLRRSERDGSPRADRPARDLPGLLESMGPLVARAHELTGFDEDPEAATRALVASPRFEFGPIGSVVHPGPWFSAADEHAGRGVEGEPVGGLALLMDRLGRFALFGSVMGGGGPDGSILARVLVEEQRGEHLGHRWSGTVAVCEGADLLSRAGRRGARIAGAALHEGYWIDIDVLRGESARWEELRRQFTGPENAARVRAVLASRGLSVTVARSETPREARRRPHALLGESQRVRLAVLADRAGEGDALGRVTLDEIVGVTGAHEEAHLCDRERFLPLGKDPLGVVGLWMQSGFTPGGVMRMLEYRAQLVAMCVVPEPRLALAEVLDGAEVGGGQVTPHAAAYAELLEDWLVELDRVLDRDPGAMPSIDPGHLLAHQLHLLSPEELRSVSLALARRRGLVAD